MGRRGLFLVALAAALGLAMGAQQCKQGQSVTITGGWCDDEAKTKQKRVITGNFCEDSASPTAMQTAFQAMVQSWPKVQICSLDPNVQMTDADRARCRALKGTTNPCLGYYSEMCALVGGTPREDACSKQRFCKNPFTLYSQQCTKDEDCAGSNVAKPPFNANREPVADNLWKMQRPCCDSLKANIEQICEGVTDAVKESTAFSPISGICANQGCYYFSSASSLPASTLLAAAASLLAVAATFWH
jgi:hypothetical protein